MSDYQVIDLAIGGIISLMALLIAFWQLKINDHLRKLHDQVSLTLLGNTGNNGDEIKFINTGNVNLYIHKAESFKKKTGKKIGEEIFEPHHMIPSNSDYAFLITGEEGFEEDEEIWAKIYLSDELDRKWISTHGGIKENDELNVWTNDIQEIDWLSKDLEE